MTFFDRWIFDRAYHRDLKTRHRGWRSLVAFTLPISNPLFYGVSMLIGVLVGMN